MTSTNLDNLQDFLNQNEIPKIKGKPKTFLGITKQPHYENVISNIYAFFFNTLEEHGFENLFIKSLLELIQVSELGKENIFLVNSFSDFDIATEFSTNKRGRIDLLLSNYEQAIIIENKVYHYLDNDLDDYWDSVTSSDKVGVILSLHPISKSNYAQYRSANSFINFTHLEFLKQIQINLGNYILDSSEKYTTFLKDFMQNMTNLSSKAMNKKEIYFYFKNQQKIRDTKVFMENIESHIKVEIEKVGGILNGVNLNNPRSNANSNNVCRFFISKVDKNLMFTILFDKLFSSENKLVIIVELQNETLDHKESYRNIDFTEDELQICFTNNFLNTNNFWAHFALKEYILEANDIHDLSSFILDKLGQDHLLSIFKKLELFLDNRKSI